MGPERRHTHMPPPPPSAGLMYGKKEANITSVGMENAAKDGTSSGAGCTHVLYDGKGRARARGMVAGQALLHPLSRCCARRSPVAGAPLEGTAV